MAVLINDTTQTTVASPSGPKFSLKNGDIAVLRSTNLDGSAVISLFYLAPDGKTLGPATYSSGTNAGSQLTLTPTRPEEIINVPGMYTVEVTTAANTQGVVFVSQ